MTHAIERTNGCKRARRATRHSSFHFFSKQAFCSIYTFRTTASGPLHLRVQIMAKRQRRQPEVGGLRIAAKKYPGTIVNHTSHDNITPSYHSIHRHSLNPSGDQSPSLKESTLIPIQRGNPVSKIPYFSEQATLSFFEPVIPALLQFGSHFGNKYCFS